MRSPWEIAKQVIRMRHSFRARDVIRECRDSKKNRPNRTKGRPVGEMNSPQGEGWAVLREKGWWYQTLASLDALDRSNHSHWHVHPAYSLVLIFGR
jgi:hypothetical protein